MQRTRMIRGSLFLNRYRYLLQISSALIEKSHWMSLDNEPVHEDHDKSDVILYVY